MRARWPEAGEAGAAGTTAASAFIADGPGSRRFEGDLANDIIKGFIHIEDSLLRML